MVDALRSAGRVLRRGGLVVDLQPADDYTPRLAIVSGRHRTELGAIARTSDAGVAAAHRARRRAVAEGAFSYAVSTHGSHRTLYRGLPDLRWVLRQNENWRIEPALWRRLIATWARRPDGAQIEIRRAYSLAVLRKRG
ncbi:MAG TPA: hypothetical protein VGS01_03610 [Candidatus Limnocylindria bacterium]|jgi:hypothetical protein|nr:hypothetical protein [Candidatus Limnocylindria bacterium]